MAMPGMMSSAALAPPMPEVEEFQLSGLGEGSLQRHHSGRMMVNNPLNKALFLGEVALGVFGIRGFPPQILVNIGWIERTCFLGIHFVSK